jgi:hypothetical protein
MIYPRKTYLSCSELPLFNFIKIVVNDDTSYLYSEPKKPWNKPVDLPALWEGIFNEYSALSGNKQNAHILSLIKEITVLNNKLLIIQEAVSYLSHTFDVRLCNMLRGMGFLFQYNPDSMMNDLKLTISSAKRIIIQKQQAEKEFSALDQDKSKVTEKDYNALLTQLSKYMKFKIDPKQTSVLDFVNYIEAFNQEHKSKKDG